MNTVVSVASLASAAAVAAPSISPSTHHDDAEIRRLWEGYSKCLAEIVAAQAAYRPIRGKINAALEQQIDEDTPWEVSQALHDVAFSDPEYKRAHKIVSQAFDNICPWIRAIHQHQATTLFGIGAKLAALPSINTAFLDHCSEDFEEAAIAVTRDIDTLLGTDFSARFKEYGGDSLKCWGAPDADEDKASPEASEGKTSGKRALDPDPVWKAIERHQKARARITAFSPIHTAAENRTFELMRAERLDAAAERAFSVIDKKWNRIVGREATTLRALFQTKPTTQLGALALSEYCENKMRADDWVLGILDHGDLLAMVQNVRIALTPTYAQKIRSLVENGALTDPGLPEGVNFEAA